MSKRPTGSGNGDSGTDSLVGGAGNDTYYVDSVNDYVLETQGMGTADKIVSTLSVSLNKYELSGIENVTLLGTAALTASNIRFTLSEAFPFTTVRVMSAK